MKDQQSLESFRADLQRMNARVRELEHQLAEAANGRLPEDARLEPDLIMISSMVSSANGEPMVILRWFTHTAQLPIKQARELALNLLDAAESARADAFLVSFMRQKGPEAGAALVMAFREFKEKMEA